MKLITKTILLAMATALFPIGVPRPASAAFITFDHRENLNILNSPDVVIAANFSSFSPQELRGATADMAPGNHGWYAFPSGNEVLTIDLGQVRNIKTIRATEGTTGDYGVNAAVLETSNDGVAWTVQPHSTVVGSVETTFVLDTAQNDKWLRITATPKLAGFMALNNLRVYGDVGTVTADPGLDLVASTAWTAGAAVITQTAGAGTFTPAAGLTDMADDNHANLQSRQLVYDLGTGESVTATFATTVTNIGRVGFTFTQVNTSFDTGMHFQFLGSTDGINFTTTLLDQTGGLVAGPNFFDLPSTFTGDAVRLYVVSSSGTNNGVADMFVFQVPEPASLGMVALGGMLLLRRRRA